MMEPKKKKLNYKIEQTLIGTFDAEDDYKRVVAMVRSEAKEFRMTVAEIAKNCATNHVSPYDVFSTNREMANRVIDELLRAQKAKMLAPHLIKGNSK